MATVAVLGLGAMGTRMAANLITDGHQVTVWNRSLERTASLASAGAMVAQTPRDAADGADFVICCVRDDGASRQVWLDENTGALAAMAPKSVGIDSSTLTVDWAKRLSGYFDQRGIAFLDAPVAGSRPAAEARQLVYLVGGSSDVLEMAKPILESLSGAIHHAGPAGSGAAVKLMVNALLGIQVAAMGELLGFAKNTGLDVARALEIMSSIPVCSPVAGGLGEAMLERQFDPLFPVELAEKDLGYLASTAEAMNTDVPVTQSARSVFCNSIENGDGGLNITSIAKQYLS